MLFTQGWLIRARVDPKSLASKAVGAGRTRPCAKCMFETLLLAGPDTNQVPEQPLAIEAALSVDCGFRSDEAPYVGCVHSENAFPKRSSLGLGPSAGGSFASSNRMGLAVG